MIVKTSIKKGQQSIKTIPRAAGTKSYENHWNHWKVPLKKGMKINKGQKTRRIKRACC